MVTIPYAVNGGDSGARVDRRIDRLRADHRAMGLGDLKIPDFFTTFWSPRSA
jgi:hypothetical protein